MHCVAVYPTQDNQLVISRIAALRERYANIPIGYSTHENPSNLLAGSLALAAGATILERHVGSESNGSTLNSYSSDQAKLLEWLNALSSSIEMLGIKSKSLDTINPQEVIALSGLRRYAFAQKDIQENVTFTSRDLDFAIPGVENQLQANDIGKYQILQATKQIKAGEAITLTNTKIKTSEKLVFDIRDQILTLIKLSGITIPKKSSLEISHHYGLENFLEFGVTMITIINRDYCKKLLILLPGQTHPGMYHKVKDESFFLLFGDLNLKLNNIEVPIKEGEIVSIIPTTIHEFSSTNGAIIEEVSTSHLDNDSFYVDEIINQNKNRKTVIQYWL
jgi:mannose-6-phosphate isomerase-like protein (cupin superfamily)